MSEKLFMFNGVFAAICAAIFSVLGGWSPILQFLICLIVADYVTGVCVGITTKTLCSSTGFKGLIKKMVILIMVWIAAQMDATMSEPIVRNVVIFFYISNEGISFLENTAKLGVKYPPIIKDTLLQLKNLQKGANNENSN